MGTSAPPVAMTSIPTTPNGCASFIPATSLEVLQAATRELTAALAVFQSAGPDAIPGAFSLAISYTFQDDAIEACLRHPAGGEIRSGSIDVSGASHDAITAAMSMARALVLGLIPDPLMPSMPMPVVSQTAETDAKPRRGRPRGKTTTEPTETEPAAPAVVVEPETFDMELRNRLFSRLSQINEAEPAFILAFLQRFKDAFPELFEADPDLPFARAVTLNSHLAWIQQDIGEDIYKGAAA